MSDPRRLLLLWLVAGLLAVGVLPRSASAQGAQGKFERHLTAAIRLYQSLEYERALTQVDQARKQPHSSDQEVELSLYEGIILAESGKQESSATAFKSALLVQPDAKLPVKVAPKVSASFEAVRTQVKKELEDLAAKEAAKAAPPPQPEPKAAPPPAVDTQSPVLKGLRSAAPVTAIAGGTLFVAGGITYALSRSELSRLRGDGADLQSQEAVDKSVSKGRTLQTVGVGLALAGTAGLITAAGGFLLGSPEKPVAVGVGTDGTSAFVFGRWP